MEGILCVLTLYVGTPIGFLLSLTAVIGAANRNEKRTGNSTLGPALIGGFMPIALVFAGLFGYAAIEDFNDKTERAEAGLADFLIEVAPGLPQGEDTSAQPWDLSDVVAACEVGTRWWDTRSIDLGAAGVDSTSYLYDQLLDDGWVVEFSRAGDPLGTYETWVVAAIKGGNYLDARTRLSPGQGTMELVFMVGPCVEKQGRAMVRSAGEPGVVVEPSFTAPEFRGLTWTTVDPELWKPRPMRIVRHGPQGCGVDSGLARSDRRELWSSNPNATHLVYVEDPYNETVRWLAEMHASFEAEGWETNFQRLRDVEPVADSEKRTLLAHRGDRLVRLSAHLDGGNADPYVQIETDVYQGSCVADMGLDLLLPLEPGYWPLKDPWDFKPIVRKDQ